MIVENSDSKLEVKTKDVKFFNFFDLIPSNHVFKFLSLKVGAVLLTLIPCISSLVQLGLDYYFSRYYNKFYPMFIFFLFSPMNFSAFVFMVRSVLYDEKFKNSYLANICMTCAFALHLCLLIINMFFNFHVSSINLYYLYPGVNGQKGINDDLLTFGVPNFIYLAYEAYVSWICYSYTKFISIGDMDVIEGKKEPQICKGNNYSKLGDSVELESINSPNKLLI